MRSLKEAAVIPGMTATPLEINLEFKRLASDIAQLDRDNFPTPPVLTAAKVKVGAWHRLKTEATASIANVSHVEGQDEAEFNIPDFTGEPWEMLYDSIDGYCSVSLFVVIQTIHPVWVGIRKSGTLVAKSGWQDNTGDMHSFLISGVFPVGTGPQRIEPVYCHRFDSGSASSWTTTFHDRRLTVKESLR